jgi:hypothetical protein
MEKLADEPVWEDINLCFDRTQTLMTLIRKDWEAVRSMNKQKHGRAGQ